MNDHSEMWYSDLYFLLFCYLFLLTVLSRLSAHTMRRVVATLAHWLTTWNMLDKYFSTCHSLISVISLVQGPDYWLAT